MKFSAVDFPTTRHIERIEIMAAETEAGSCGVTWQRKNRRHTAVAVENLHSHPRGHVGSSIAVHTNSGRAAVVRPGGNIEVVERLSRIDRSVGPDTVAQASAREALGDKQPQAIRRESQPGRSLQIFVQAYLFPVCPDEPKIIFQIACPRHRVDVAIVTNGQACDVKALISYFGWRRCSVVCDLDDALSTGRVRLSVRCEGKRPSCRWLSA